MKALTIHQPWASFMAMGLKKIETRGRKCHIRERVAICAGKTTPAGHQQFLKSLYNFFNTHISGDPEHKKFYKDFARLVGNRDNFITHLPLGAVVATADIVDCQPTERLRETINPIEFALGNYEDGRFGWIMDNIKPLETPIPIIGKQGFFNIPDIEMAA
ncbi:MAG: hypothetical protein COB49_07465 [Alphaproteobacteria bacterium]|nr:MAG: hypothetical protein COB49_07465 [Alphaproteobacteria bacterium]